MYIARAFSLADERIAWQAMAAWPFATVVDLDGGEAHHLPLAVDPVGRRIDGHLARANPLADRIDGGAVLVVFGGPHSYVSPRWYERPFEQVPTWNYVSVHVAGRLVALDDAGLLASLRDLAAAHEPAGGWTLDWIDAGLRDDLLPGIRGFTIAVDRVEAKAKLSQNRSRADQARVVAALDDAGSCDLAGWMRRILGLD